MSLPDLVVRRPVTTTMVYVAVVLLGFFSLGRLAIDLIPEISFPSLSISSSYSGVAPEEIERLITIPLEQAVSSVSGITSMSSTSSEGSSRVSLNFDWGTDLDAVANEVRAAVQRVRGRLPSEASEPQVGSFNASASPIMTIALSGDTDSATLRQLAEEEFTYYLERLEGVAAVSVQGGRSREILVKVDPIRLQAHGISIDQVAQAIRAENFNVPAGRIVVGQAQFTLRSIGELKTVEELKTVQVARRNGAKTYLQDIATIEQSGEDGGMIVRVDGLPGITLSVQKQSGANTVRSAAAVRKALKDLQQRYPELNIRVISDSSVYIQKAIDNVVSSGLFGGLLAILVLLLFLQSVRLTVIISVAMPVSFIGAFILIEQAGMTLNLMSLGGLALGVGMLVDNSIVVLENTYRHLMEGKSPKEAAIIGTKEMTPSIVASTLTTVAVFVPMMYVSGMTGILFRQLSLMVAFSILCSMAVALTLLPVMSAYMLRRNDMEGSRGGIFSGIGNWLKKSIGNIEAEYAQIVRNAIRRPGFVLSVAAVIFVGSLALVPLLGRELISMSDEGELSVSFSLPSGTKLETTDAMAREIEGIIKETVPELQAMDVRVGSGGGRGTNSGSANLVLVSRGQRRRSTDEVRNDLRERLAQIPGLTSRVSVRSNMAERMASGSFGGGGSDRISINVQGYQLPLVRQTAAELAQVIAQVPGVSDASVARSSEQPEFILRIDKDRAADVGLTTTQIANTVQTAVQGRSASQITINGDEYPIRVAVAGAEGLQPSDIEALPISVSGGQYIRLQSVAQLITQDSPTAIDRLNQQRTARVTASPEGRDLGSVVADVREAIYDHGLPDGVMVYFGGEYEEQQRAFREMLIVILLAIALVYSVMAGQFESLFDPLLVMFSVPFALTGVIITLFLTRTPLTTQAFMGLIMLGGIVVNNAIILISYTSILREQGYGLVEAVEQSARTRLRPILMTTGTTILGLLPMAVAMGEGGEIQAPLARTVIGGLTVSTVVTLILIPTLYLWSHNLIENRRARKHAAKAVAVSVALICTLLGGVVINSVAHAEELPSLTWDSAVKAALQTNAQMQSTRAKLLDAESRLREAQAAYRTRFTLDGGYDVRKPIDNAGSAYSQQGTVGVQLRQTFKTSTLLGKPNEAISLAQIAVDSARHELANVTSTVTISLMSTYMDVLNANAQLSISRYSQQRAVEAVKEAEYKYNLKMLSAIELQQAKSQLTSANIALEKAQNTVRLALARLNMQMGVGPFTQWQVGPESGLTNIQRLPVAFAADEPPAADLQQALERYEVKQARNQLQRAETSAANRTRGNAPVFTASAGVTGKDGRVTLQWDSRSYDTALVAEDDLYSRTTGSLFSGGSQVKNPYGSLGVAVTWPLFDGGVEREKALQEASQLEQLRKQLEQQERQITLEVYESYFSLQEAGLRAEAAEATRQTAADRLSVTRQRAELGAATSIEVLDAELAYMQAEQSKREADMAVVLAEMRYRKASGREVWPQSGQ